MTLQRDVIDIYEHARDSDGDCALRLPNRTDGDAEASEVV